MQIKKLLLVFFLLYFTFTGFTKDYKKIDNYVLKTPTIQEKSLDGLVDFLIKPAKDDYEKARAIYCWVANNIKYNTDGFFSGNYGDNSVETVFTTKSAVCEGYANIFKAMAEMANLECIKIYGYSKGFGYIPGKKFSGNYDHVWNAIKIDGKYYLIDTTWGAGNINEKKIFVPKYTDFYFLTSPEKFIYSHFPNENKWQLLETPITLKEFEKMILPTLELFEHGLSIVSHKEAVINNIEKNLTINIGSPEDVLMMTMLMYNEKEFNNMILLSKEENGYDIKMLFPQKGKYILNIFVKNKSESGLYFQALQYIINVVREDTEAKGFPLVYEDFYKHDCYLYTPSDGKLKMNSRQVFKIKSPDILEIAVVTEGKDWTFLTKKKDIFEGAVFIKKGKILIYAKYPKKDLYWTLLEYEGL